MVSSVVSACRRLGFFLPLLISVSIIATSCGTGDSSSNTTTIAVTTSRAPQPGPFVAESVDQQAAGFFILTSSVFLTDTPWTMDKMGNPEWFAMLTGGALAACEAYHSGASTGDAMQAALDVSPLKGQVPESDDVDAYDLVSSFMIGGIDTYCPTLIDTIYGSLFAIGLDPAWEDLTGGPAPFRPIRLPD